MGTVCHCIYTTFSVLLAVRLSLAVDNRGRIFMVRSPESLPVPIGDEVTIECEMNIKPDGFRWRHYPLLTPNSIIPIKIDEATAYEVPESMYVSTGTTTTVTINVNSTAVAGDYQCLAIYGASVLASVPGRITIAGIGDFPSSKNTRQFVTTGNTVAIRCDLPPSNPLATVKYYKSNSPLSDSLILPTGTLLLQNVSSNDAGTYTCSVENYITLEKKTSSQKTFLGVTPSSGSPEEPKFLTVPPLNYTVTAGENIFMECSAVGNPPPKVTWLKLGGTINQKKFSLLPGGVLIKNVTSADQGTYVCSHGSLKHHISLLFYERPTVSYSSPLPEVNEGENLDFECTVKGTPEPIISWLINGHSVLNDSNIEVIGNKIYFRPVEKRHAGILQCLASNVVGADYGYTFLNIYPKQISTSVDSPTTVKPKTVTPTYVRKPRPSKNPIMIPPSKPNVTRLSDESVMVRWSVPENDGLPIQFFKVQYRELGSASQPNGARSKSSRWKTTNADILPHLRSYAVDNLKPDHLYRFRIAAVYSNNDNKLGLNSAKFHLKREDFFAKNPLPAPKLTHTEAVSNTSIRIYWDYTSNTNITIDGFYVNYQLTSSAGDYLKVTVDGEQTRSYIITYLLPDTAYDIKLQSYTQSGVSDFSAVMQQKTLKLPREEPIVPPLKKEESQSPSQLYIIVGAAVAGVVVLAGAIIAIFILKKKKEKNASGSIGGNDRSDKGGGNIQPDSNGYKIPRGLANGCGPNRITITPNPLADADDNQNQNSIEMSCLSSQNNNCSADEASASNDNAEPLPSKIKSVDNIKSKGKIKTESAPREFV